MLPDATLQVPASLMTLLSAFTPLSTAPSFRTFCGLACGFLAQPGKRTVCGMLTGRGCRGCGRRTGRTTSSPARWSPDDLVLAAARMVVSLLVPADAPVDVAVDGTLLKRRGNRHGRPPGFMTGRSPRYRKTEVIEAALVPCLWCSVFGSRPVTVVLVRDKPGRGFGIALVTTDRDATMTQVIERYASRRSIEVAAEDSKQLFGSGQARNRTARAVEATIPFEIACQAIAVTWYATAGRNPGTLQERRRNLRGTRPSPSRPPATCPPCSAESSSPPDLRHLALASRHAKNSTPSDSPGKTQPHKRESRVRGDQQNSRTASTRLSSTTVFDT
jgi:hypothetical protein